MSRKLRAEYPFLNGFKLTAIVEYGTGKQILKISKIDNSGKEIDSAELECIHVAIKDISAESIGSGELANGKPIIDALSTEHVRRIDLGIAEKFRAFKSWVQGIAEAGYNAFYIQREIEHLAGFTYPISKFLMGFAAKHDPRILEEFLFILERNCRIFIKEGDKLKSEWHRSSLTANLITISKVKNAIDYCINMEIPFDVMVDVFGTAFIRHPGAVNYPEFGKIFLEGGWRFREAAAGNPDAPFHPGYYVLFDDYNFYVRTAVVSNPNAPVWPQYRRFFREESWHIRRAAAANKRAAELYPKEHSGLFPPALTEGKTIDEIISHPTAIRYAEFKLLFTDINMHVRMAVAACPRAVEFREFKFLFGDKVHTVRAVAAANPRAPELDEYRVLFASDDIGVYKAIAANPGAVRFPEFGSLFDFRKKEIRHALASNPGAVKFARYSRFFYSKDNHLRFLVASNPSAPFHPKFGKLFTDSVRSVRMAAAININAVKHPAYSVLLGDPDREIRMIAEKRISDITERKNNPEKR